jgi:hypothetical protein
LALGIGTGLLVSRQFVEAVVASLIAAFIWSVLRPSTKSQDE